MTLNPFIAALLEARAASPALSAGSPEAARAALAAGRGLLGPASGSVDAGEVSMPTRSGTMRARLLCPPGQRRGIVVYLHGGGWVIGAIEDFDVFGRSLAAQSGCIVILPEYRLAPEHAFPAGLHDSEDAISWAAAERGTLAGADAPLIVMGDSAGANLATVAARSLRGEIGLAAQILIYPIADCSFSTRSYRRFAAGYGLTARDMKWFFTHYAPPEAWAAPEISPLRAPELKAMPPATIVTAECDVLADEGAAYAEALQRDGVPTIHRRIDGVTHGFLRFHNLFDVAQRELERLAGEIAERCNAWRAKA